MYMCVFTYIPQKKIINDEALAILQMNQIHEIHENLDKRWQFFFL